MPVGNTGNYTETLWGRVPSEKSVVYSFSTESGARQRQDVGLNGLTHSEERSFGIYKDYLDAVQGKISQAAYDSIFEDPAGDGYHYYRGSDFDARQASILERYKHINGTEGNSPNSSESGESYSTAYKTTPDVEDINQDYTMNEYEKFAALRNVKSSVFSCLWVSKRIFGWKFYSCISKSRFASVVCCRAVQLCSSFRFAPWWAHSL